MGAVEDYAKMQDDVSFFISDVCGLLFRRMQSKRRKILVRIL